MAHHRAAAHNNRLIVRWHPFEAQRSPFHLAAVQIPVTFNRRLGEFITPNYNSPTTQLSPQISSFYCLYLKVSDYRTWFNLIKKGKQTKFKTMEY